LAALLALLVATKGHLLNRAERVSNQATSNEGGGVSKDFSELNVHWDKLLFVSARLREVWPRAAVVVSLCLLFR
jgi:hypothetical protein